MSISTRINGFTAWINLRLSNSSGQLLDNVLVDLLKGYNMKMLLESKKPSVVRSTFNNTNSVIGLKPLNRS